METKIFDLKKDTKRIIVIIIAALLMAVNIKTFVQAGNLLPGGATGLTLLIQRAVKLFFDLDIPYSPINILLNAIPAFIGFKFIGKKFTIYSCLMIFLVGLFADLIPAYTITDDVLLVSIFGGLINGAAISICLSVEATSGGTDFIAIYMSEKKHMDSWNFVLGINAVKGFEYGMGFSGVAERGSQQNDIFVPDGNGGITTLTNNSGGIQGGISNGQDIYFRVAFKPVATLLREQQTVTQDGRPTTLKARGRHDACVLPRAVPVVEAMAAITLLDAYLQAKR